jgi:hypothetical protein
MAESNLYGQLKTLVDILNTLRKKSCFPIGLGVECAYTIMGPTYLK